jgi:methylenetetrahydrofolate dehydrogenase (NADP+)/methenyltetrahydrofolate cyclohydrolase
MNRDRRFFKKAFRNKKIVLMGRGITGGKPIGKTLTDAKINYIGINSKTPDATTYLKEADVIVTAVGKKVILPEMLKPGVVLINVGLRRENGRLRGDYDEAEIKKIASFYTPTPGGIGPIDVMYLYKNLIESYKLQK